MVGRDLEGSVCAHPLRDVGYDAFEVPVLAGDFVTADQGNIVHQAPAMVRMIFIFAKHTGLSPEPETVLDNGTYVHVPLFAGQHIYKISDPMVEALVQAKVVGG